jgi:hypothetical protein
MSILHRTCLHCCLCPILGSVAFKFHRLNKVTKDLLIFDRGGFAYINPAMFPGAFAQDVDPAEAHVMAIVQKPVNQSIIG